MKLESMQQALKSCDGQDYDVKVRKKLTSGKVFLVGAGPGDADLLTVKALRLIQSCDVILYDKLVSKAIQDLFPIGTKKFFVGKSKSNHSIPQSQLNQLMVTLANKGHSICRLKGGDPFIFGRGSEEMLVLKKARIQTEIIPGITAASGCSSYAGIPLTHRGVSQGCTFVTGHEKESQSLNQTINWKSLATSNHTLVFYMGLSQINNIYKELSEHGLPSDTPAALIENGCQKTQRVITTTLDNLAIEAQLNQLVSPSIIIIGGVVKLREELQWFEELNTQPLDKTNGIGESMQQTEVFNRQLIA